MKKLSNMFGVLARLQLIIAFVVAAIIILVITLIKNAELYFTEPVMLIFLILFALYVFLMKKERKYQDYEEEWGGKERDIKREENNLTRLIVLAELTNEEVKSLVETSVKIKDVILRLYNSEHDIGEISLELKEEIRETKISLLEKRIELIEYQLSAKHKKYLYLQECLSKHT